ncbi:MAG: D-alanyl-D-alanine carboxypeptidase family protein [Sandaracinaceae bacterium]|nr:D-alanyl-D-alanine carboxypeptidase family protein [Sandaracinaceae bacterium]
MNGVGVVTRALLLLSAASATLLTTTTAAHAQTMSQVAAGQSSCTTAGGEGLSTQLVDGSAACTGAVRVVRQRRHHRHQRAGAPGGAGQRAHRAADGGGDRAARRSTSGFRPLSDQYLLWASGQCAVVGVPGSSNHQSGRAVDVNNTVEARTALTNAGCVWFGASDAVHYDCPAWTCAMTRSPRSSGCGT